MKTTSIDRTLEIRPEANSPRKIQAALVALLAVMALVLLSGCASVQGNPDPLQYSPNTGYPAVGGEFPWVFGL